MNHPDTDAIARVHRTLLPAAARLCHDGAAIVLRLSARSDLHDRLTVLRLSPDDGQPEDDLLSPWRPKTIRALLTEAALLLRRAPARARALASLRYAAGLLAQSESGAVAVVDARYSALLTWTEGEIATAWRLSLAESYAPLPRRRALSANEAAATLATMLMHHQRGDHPLPPGSLVLLNGNGPVLPDSAHARIGLKALWDSLRQDPDACGALLTLFIDAPLLMLGVSGPEPNAMYLVASLSGGGETLLPLWLGRC